MPFHSNTDGTRDDQRQTDYNIIYMWNLKKKDNKLTYLKNKNRLTDIEKNYGKAGVRWVVGRGTR